MDFQLDNNNNIGTVPKQKQRKHKSRKESLTLNKKKSTKKAVTPRFTPPTSELNSMEADEASEALTQDLSLHSEHDDTQEERTDSTMEGQSFRGHHSKTTTERPVVPKLPKARTHGVLLNNDELFTLSDHLAKKIIYAPLSSVSAEKVSGVRHIIAFNLTQEHFEPGATQWYHLKDAPFQFVSSIFDSLAYFTNKKPRNSVPEKPARPTLANNNNNKKKRTASDGDNQDEQQQQVVDREAEEEVSNFMNGDRDTSVFIETLVTRDGRVGGYRVWIMHKAVAKGDHDMFALALRESLLGASKVKDLAAKQITAITKASNQKGGGGKSKAVKQYGISKEFSYVNFDSFESHFLGLVRPYFTRDSHLLVDDEDTQQQATTRAHQEQNRFKDTRAFQRYDTLKPAVNQRDYTKLTHPCNFSNVFSKEAAMLYYVRAANIDDTQCRLESYFGGVRATRANFTDENAHCHVDVNALATMQEDASVDNNTTITGVIPPLPDVADLSHATPDETFYRFPHEHITHHMDNAFLCAEFMGRAPLPYRLGASLYTMRDMADLKQRVNLPLSEEENAALNEPVAEEEEEESVHIEDDEMLHLMRHMGLESESDNEERANVYRANARTKQAKYGAMVRYLGLHETEFEVTAEVMLNEPDHVDRVTLEHMRSAAIPREIISKFIASKSNEVQARLKQILGNLGYKHRIVIRECVTNNNNNGIEEGSKSKTKKRLEIREYPATGMDLVTHGYPIDEKDHAMILQLPYLASTPPGIVLNRNKRRQIERKAHDYLRRYAYENADDDETARQLQREYEERDYDAKVASGYVGHFKDTISQYRPWGNSLHVLKTQLRMMKLEEVYLRRDIFLRLDELNREAYRNLDLAFYDPVTGQLPLEREEAYMRARRELRDAIFVEFWHEFFTNANVSLPCEGIRNDLLKQRHSYVPPLPGQANATPINGDMLLGKKIIGLELPLYDYNKELRPWSSWRVEIRRLSNEEAGITFNYKIVETLYFAKFHHGRWYPDCNDPKLNIILSGNGAAGKSKALDEIINTLPTSVGYSVTHITDQAFNVDRNLNDMLLIYHEFQNKYLGYSGGNSGGGPRSGAASGNSAGSDKDTTNFFKSRLTSGSTSVMSWYENEETGLRDMRISKAHCQGNIFGASNNDFTDADVNVMSRFILLSVPKSKNQIRGLRPQDRNKPTYGMDASHSQEVYEYHREIHRVVYLCEQMIKSNVINDTKYGVNVDGARIMIDFILDHMQKCYGIQTNDTRKRGHILELARSMALSYAVWFGLTSEETRHLFYDPHEPTKYIGLNPRVILEGILPYMVVTKDMVFDAITCLSSLWIHEYQDTILESFAKKHCKLDKLHLDSFMRRIKNDTYISNPRSALVSSRGGGGGSDFHASYGGGGRTSKDDCDVDYNYVVIRNKTREAIHHALSVSLGEMIVAANDIGKLFHELSHARIEACEGYTMTEIPGEVDPETGFQAESKRRLVRAGARSVADRYVVEFGHDPVTGKQTIGVLVQFLKQKLPSLLTDDVIEDLNKKPGDYDTVIRSIEDIRRLDPEDGDYMREDDTAANELDEDEACDAKERELFREIRRVGTVDDHSSTLFIKSFKDIMENEVLEDIGASKEYMRRLEESYMNPVTKQVPWMTFVIADPPKPRPLTTFHPELKESIEAANLDTKPIYFVDQLLMMNLKRRKNGKKLIINNYNTISPSTRASLALYKQACEREANKKKRAIDMASQGDEEDEEEEDDSVSTRRVQTLKKARIEEYGKTAAWELDRDIDYIFCQEHLRNIAYPGLWKRKENEYATPNYPACTYMSIMEKREAKALAAGKETLPLLEYPFINIVNRVSQEKEKLKGELDPASVQYPSFSRFMDSNLSENSRLRLCSSTGDMEVEEECIIGKPLKRSLAEERKKRYSLAKEFIL